MVELDLSRAKQAMQDIGTVLSRLLGGPTKGSVAKPQTREELVAAVAGINTFVNGR